MTGAWGMGTARLDTYPLPPEPASPPPLSHPGPASEDAAFAGRYHLRSCRGEGGMAMVYDAIDLHTGNLVAVKMLRYELIRNQEARLRFQCEAQVLSRLVHPNVVSLLDFGRSAGGRPFLVMEHLEGRNLGEIISREGALSAERAFRIALQACRGLQAVHGAGVIHRDVKPDNLFVCPGPHGTEQVKILDFGIAKVCVPTDPLARMIEALDMGRVVGTPHYMSPEQVCDPDNVNEQSDVFSLGVALSEALTGMRPHDGKSGGTIIDEILGNPLKAATDYHPGVSRELCGVVDPALAYDRRERYASAPAFGKALAAALHALAVSASACAPRR